MVKTVRDPLRKRYLRELKEDAGKYLMIFLLLVLSISEISGFMVASGSMIEAYNESFEKYTVEDGNFTVESELSGRRREMIEDLGLALCENFSADLSLTNGTTMRFFTKRTQMDLECLMEGAFPEGPAETAVDRMYADNNGICVGDTITWQGGTDLLVTGLVALSDYSTLYESNNDMMFDAKQFGVAVLTPEGFSKIDSRNYVYRYSFLYNDPPADEEEESERSQELSKQINRIAHLTDFVPRYLNQAIQFTGTDMGSDSAMMEVFLYIITAVAAFIFAVTISNTILKEAGVIGTLRASGYTKAELLRHYMVLPTAVTLFASLIGNILGYTLLKDFNAGLYYNSYSLPTYVTRWNGSAFIRTTLIPIVLMLVINLFILARKLRLSPLRFLRRDLGRSRKRGAMRLSPHIPFMTRFRIRVILQNTGGYLLLAAGILLANFLLLFGLMFPSVLGNYMDSVGDNMLAPYQYILQIPAGAVDEDHRTEAILTMLVFENEMRTENPDAEKFSAYTLRSVSDGTFREEDVMLYGIEPDSRYVNAKIADEEFYISSVYADKYGIRPGSTLTLKEPYEDRTYTFTVTGITDYEGSICAFMTRDTLNRVFDLGTDTYSGFFSSTEITDLNPKYIGQVIDFEALTKVSRQLTISMGDMMYLVDAFAVIIYLILMYLLTKLIIEKNAQPISMTKILGYENREIAALYLLATSAVVLIVLLLSTPVEALLMKAVFRKFIVMKMSGWIPFAVDASVYVRMILMGIASYAFVALFEYRRIRRIPMEEALKNVE